MEGVKAGSRKFLIKKSIDSGTSIVGNTILNAPSDIPIPHKTQNNNDAKQPVTKIDSNCLWIKVDSALDTTSIDSIVNFSTKKGR